MTLNHIFGVEPVKITSPPTDSEVALALRVLEGCCLLHSGSVALAYKYKAVKVQFARCYILNPEWQMLVYLSVFVFYSFFRNLKVGSLLVRESRN